MKLKEKHWELGRHYARFVDRRWHPDFVLTAASLEIFIRVESYGRSSCTADELAQAEPLFNGKMQRELTIKLLFDEMADWWSTGAGWYYPIAHALRTEMWEHGRPQRDRVYIRALVKVMRSCHQGGFMPVMLLFTGMPQAEKERYCARWRNANPLSARS